MKLFLADGHLHDAALLLCLSGELDSNAASRADAHLLLCPTCRLRKEALRAQEAALVFARPSLRVPQPDQQRMRLEAGLRAATSQDAHRSAPHLWSFSLHQLPLLRIAAVAALLVVAATWRQASRPLQDLMAAYEETGPKPDHALTPGSASPLTLAQLCSLSDDNLDPELSPEKQRAVFQAYRMDQRASKAYQVDYLINPQLGGNDSLENLWPEPYHATVWNATAKDALETRLHVLVCSGQLDLQRAQQEIATDWIAAYKKYFHTAHPVRTVAAAAALQ